MRTLRKNKADQRDAGMRKKDRVSLWQTPPGRGDFAPWIAIVLYVIASLCVVAVAHRLVPKFPLYFLFLFTLVYTPIMSYVDARLIGICGQHTSIPMVKEAAIILSGYKGIDIWMAPIPVDQFAGQAVGFRVSELTGTNFFSYVKSTAITLPLSFGLSLLFWSFIWKSGVIPSDLYPYAQKMWELNAKNTMLLFSSTMEVTGGKPLFYQALHPWVIGGAFSFSLVTFTLLTCFRLPIMAIFGFVQSVGGMPHGFILLVVGAMIGKFYFHPRFGHKRFLQIVPVLMAGYGTGVGLIALIGVAANLVNSAVSGTPF